MDRRSLAALAMVGTLSLTACAQPPSVNDPADLAAVATLRNGFITAMNTGDAAAFTQLYTADGISMTNHEKTAAGRDAIVEAQKGVFAQASLKMELTAQETWTMGEVGFDRGSFKMTVAPKAGGDPMVQEGRYLVLLRKETDGKWRVSRDIDNSTMPMPMPAPPAAPADNQKPAGGKK